MVDAEDLKSSAERRVSSNLTWGMVQRLIPLLSRTGVRLPTSPLRGDAKVSTGLYVLIVDESETQTQTTLLHSAGLPHPPWLLHSELRGRKAPFY